MYQTNLFLDRANAVNVDLLHISDFKSNPFATLAW